MKRYTILFLTRYGSLEQQLLSGLSAHYTVSVAQTRREAIAALSAAQAMSATEYRKHDALALAKARATAQDLICVTGSLMLVGEVKALVRGCGMSPLRG